MVQETIIIEQGEKTLEDLIEEQRAKLHREGKKARIGQGRRGEGGGGRMDQILLHT